MAKVTLDMETFKALASASRLQVLRALDERRKTLSELAKELELNKATVHEHLGILLATGLVKKQDEGRKWIYYELTWQGERLLHPQETTTFAVLLGFGIAAAGGGVAMLGSALNWWWAENQVSMEALPEDGGAPEAAPQAGDSEDASDGGGGSDGADTAGSGEQNGMAADRAEGDGGMGDGAESADTDSGMDFFSTDDPDGILALLLFATAVLLIVLGFVIRKARRGSA